jgi:hypothetical protein
VKRDSLERRSLLPLCERRQAAALHNAVMAERSGRFQIIFLVEAANMATWPRNPFRAA